MADPRRLSARAKLALSYAGFLVLAAALLLAAVWLFLLRGGPGSTLFVPTPADLLLVFDVRNFGPRVFSPAAVVVLAFMLVFGLVGGWVLAGRMLAPLRRITDATRLAASGTLSHRIALTGRDDEFRELADSFDAMLARLEAHVAEQRRFAANASHELRTPLATTQALLDVARADPSGVDGELLDRLHAVNARAIDLTEALLLLSRADRRAFAREPVDLSLVVEEATETILGLAEAHGVRVHTAGDVAPTLGSYALLLQMTTNLLHNAVVHNLPDHGSVQVTTAWRRDAVVLTVENSGAELSPELVATLVEPFQRGGGRQRGDHSGVGLGLAIVDSIARAHDGRLTLAPRDGGGLSATVTLPAAPAAARG